MHRGNVKIYGARSGKGDPIARAGAIQKVRKAVGATRPSQADPGTIRGDFCPGAVEANAPYRLKFQQPGDDQFLFNMIHASDSEKSFAREVRFFDKLKAPPTAA